MKVPYSWLQQILRSLPGPEAVAQLLTAQGLEVEEVSRLGQGLAGAMVARAEEVSQLTPRLWRVVLSTGRGEAICVTGAPNVHPGAIVPYAPPGSVLPDGRTLGLAEFHGQVSQGMLLSADEIGIGPDHDGILLLPQDAPLGQDLTEYLGLPEVVFDVALTPSFAQHCQNVLGVAREVAAALGLPLPSGAKPWQPATTGQVPTVTADPSLCPLYLGARLVRGDERPTPLYVQRMLWAAGMRPLIPVVDLTNYVMLEMGQPLHPFALGRLAGGIAVRSARPGEEIETLDGVVRVLAEGDIVIADREGPVALAGMMGSARAEVSADTAEVFLEAALFRPGAIASAMRRLGLRSEAAQRFAHGLPGSLPARAMRRMAELLPEIGWQMAPGAVQAGQEPQPPGPIDVDPLYVQGLLGIDLGPEEQVHALAMLGFTAERKGARLAVTPPYWRIDVAEPWDVAEEVLRSVGIDRLPETLPPLAPRVAEPPLYAFGLEALAAFEAGGYRDALSYSLCDPGELLLLGRPAEVEVANPLSGDMQALRTTLWQGLLQAVRHNLARGRQEIALCEAGRVFHRKGDEVAEEERIALVLSGTRVPFGRFDAESVDFFSLKGDVEAALGRLRIGGLSFVPSADPALHPGRQAEVLSGDVKLGVLGELHPAVAARLDIGQRVWLAELSSAALLEVRTTPQATALPRFPALIRDLAVVVDQAVPYGRLRQVLRAALGEWLIAETLFDVFTGPPVPDGKKSLALRLTLQSAERTLTEADAEAALARALRALGEQCGAQRR